MPHKHADALDVMSQATNYNNWIYKKIKPHLGRYILEIGCGIGNFSKFLINSDKLVCVDLLRPCIEKARKKYNQNNITIIEGDILNPETINKIGRFSFDTIVCLNVLEHILSDKKALDVANALLVHKGKLILMVPAMEFMFGSIDRSLGHVRRYNRTKLKTILEEASFKNISINYFNSLGVFGWLINNKLLNRKDISLKQTLFYDRFIIPFLSIIEAFIPPPFGMSLIAIAEK